MIPGKPPAAPDLPTSVCHRAGYREQKIISRGGAARPYAALGGYVARADCSGRFDDVGLVGACCLYLAPCEAAAAQCVTTERRPDDRTLGRRARWLTPPFAHGGGMAEEVYIGPGEEWLVLTCHNPARVPARQSRPAQSGGLVRLRRRWCGLGAKNFAVARSTPPSRKAGKIHAPRQPARGTTVAPFPLTASSPTFRVRAQAILQDSSHQLGRRHLLPFPPQRQRRAARASSPRHGR